MRIIAHHVNGGMRDAISLLDQLSSLDKITEEDVRQRIGQSGHEYVEQVWNAVDANDAKELLALTASLQEQGVSIEIFMRQLLGSAREQLHLAIEEKKDIGSALRRIDVILLALKDMRVSPVPSVVLETTLVGFCAKEGNVPKKEVKAAAKRVKEAKEKLVEKEKEMKEVAPTFPSTSREAPVPGTVGKEDSECADSSENSKTDGPSDDPEAVQENASFEAKELTVDAVKDAWADVIQLISTPSLRMSLKDARIGDIKDGALILQFSSSFHRDKINISAASMEVSDALEKYFHQRIGIKCIMGSGGLASGSEEKVDIADAVGEVFG